MRTLFCTVLFLISITLTAQVRNLKKDYNKEIELTTSVEDTWRLLSDVSMWEQWDSHIIDARLVGDFADNAQGSLITANSRVVNFQIIALTEGKSYTVRHKLPTGFIYLRRTVAAISTGTKVMAEVWFKGLSLKTFKKYMGNDYAVALEKELQSVQQLLEN